MRSKIRKKDSFKKRTFVLSFLILLVCLSIGYAALSEKLKINTAATIAKTVWDVHFENVRVLEGSVENTVPTISSDKTTVSLQVSLSTPGEFYAYYVDIVNNGTINAKVDSLVKTNLTSTQSNYLEYIITYVDGVGINEKDSLKVGERDTIKVIVKFKEMTDPSLLPNEPENLNLESQMVYIQDIGDGIARKRGLHYVLESQAESDAFINFGAISSDTNGLGVYKLTKIARNGEPIYYYRGDVKNNNVLFGNFCWKMIRTTSTGGVKLIYNGVPNNGVCNNTGTATEIGKSAFNEENEEPKYAGYMYDNNTIDSTIKSVVDEWFASNLVDYLDTLEDTPFYNERDYTTEGDFPLIYPPGQRVWGNIWKPDYIENVEKTTIKLGATNKEDIFTISSDIGNGALTYPVGLITSDEIILAGGRATMNASDRGENDSYYLYTGSSYWSISPKDKALEVDKQIQLPRIIIVLENGGVGSSYPNVHGVRPVISLQPSTTYQNGNGTSNSPYIITE